MLTSKKSDYSECIEAEGHRVSIHIDLLRIRIQFFFLIADADPDPVPDLGFDDQKYKKMYSWKFFYIFFGSKLAIYLSLCLHTGRVAQATGEAFSHQKRTSSTSKHENYILFSIFVYHFCPPGSGSSNLN
jgi:hypothetical protein